ncbi:MAG: hypothetical protein K2M42_06070 [Oscillospiraceae bacterium]|nr:hypothetical protein [Oscillospiraceae bacterium]
MTKQNLLDSLCDFTRDVVKDLLLPVELQEDDEAQPMPRPPEVYDHGLPDFAEAEKKAPLIIHKVITANDVWPEGGTEPISKAVVRTVFGIYHPNNQEGERALLGLIERLRLALWRQRVIGKQFKLDVKAGLDYLIYDKQLPPFYAGEMLTTWSLPSVKLEVMYGKQGYSNIRKAGPDGQVCGGEHYGPQEQ